MKKSLSFLIFLFLIGCRKENTSPSENIPLPACIQEAIAQQPGIKSVETQTVGNEVHYFINRWASYTDATDYIVNSQCDTVCFICGECELPGCYSNYYGTDWKVIWKP